MAPIPPLRCRGFQFRAEKLDNFLDIVEHFLPISAQNWQAIADVHLENYHQEAQTAESLHRKFQEISRRTGPTGDPNCPPYVIKAKRINRQLVQMIDASSGGSEAKRSDDGLSNASDSEDKGAGEFANVINEMNNTAGDGNGNGGGEEIDEEEDKDDAGSGVQGLVWLRAVMGQPGVADNGVVGAVAGVAPPDGIAPPDGVAPAVARPRGRGPGRSRTLPVGVAGFVGPPPARTPPAVAVARNGSVAPAAMVARNGSDGQMSGSSGTAAAGGDQRGRAFCTPINCRRKKSRKGDGDNDNDGSFSASKIMVMMMVQQRSKQSSRDADRMAREAELSFRREEIAMRHEEMISQLQIQREESRAHQQMMNIMLMAMMQNIAVTNQQQRSDIGGTNEHQRMEISGNNQQ